MKGGEEMTIEKLLVRLPAAKKEELKRRADDEGHTLNGLMIFIINDWLDRKKSRERDERLEQD